MTKKPMSVWGVCCADGMPHTASFGLKPDANSYVKHVHGWLCGPHRVTEYVPVKPKKRAKAKKETKP